MENPLGRAKLLAKTSRLIVALCLFWAGPAGADDGFTGVFAFNLWTFVSGGTGADFDADSSTIVLRGSQNFDNEYSQTTFTTSVAGSYLLSFDWSYETNDPAGPQWDPAGYVNGTDIQLSDSGGGFVQSGSASNVIFEGGIFGFYALSDNYFEPENDGFSTITITNFHFTPYIPVTTTWSGTESGDWNMAENWISDTGVPNGPTANVEFGAAARTDVTVDTAVELGRLRFTGTAPAYTLTIPDVPGNSLAFYGTGIDNLSGQTQTIVNHRQLGFFASAGAGNAILTNSGSNAAVTFNDTSTAGSATIIATDDADVIFAGASSARNAAIVLSDGNLDISSLSNSNIEAGSISGSGKIFLGGKFLLLGTLNTSTEISAVIQNGGIGGGADGAVTKVGTGTATLTGASTFTGSLYLDEGMVSVAVLPSGTEASAIGRGSLQFYGGTLRYTGASGTTTRFFSGAEGGGGVEITQPDTTLTLNNSFWGNNDSNPANAIVKSGPGTLALVGAGDNSGLSMIVNSGTVLLAKDSEVFVHAISQLLRINGGLVRLGGTGGDQIYNETPVTVAGGTLDLATFSETVRSVTLQSGSIVGTTGVLTGTTNHAMQSGSVSGILGGTVGLTKSTSGTVALTGTNSYSGATTITGGVLAVSFLTNGGSNSSIGRSGSGAANLVLNGGALRYTGPGASTNRLFTLGTGGGQIDASGSSAVTFISTGTVGTTGTGPRTLTLSGTNAGDNTLAAVVPNQGANATSLAKNGSGTWVVSGNNSFTGAVTISVGTLKLGAAGGASNTPLGTTAGSTAVSSGASLDLNGFTLGTAEALSITGTGAGGVGALTNGSATAATYSGAVTIGSGGATIGGTGNIILSAALAANANTLTKSGANTLTLSANSARTGAAEVSGGTLALASGTALGTSAVSLTLGGGSLALISNASGTFAPYPTTVSSNATVTVSRSSSGASVSQTLGALSLGGNTLTVAHGANFSANNTGSLAFGATTLTGNPTFVLSNTNGSTTGSLTLGALDDGGVARAITKTGAATLLFGAASGTITAGTALVINRGIAQVNAAGALGASVLVDVTVSGTAAGTTSAFHLNNVNQSIRSLTFGGTNATATSTNNAATGGGTLTLGGNVTYDATGNPLSSTLSGNLALGGSDRTFAIGDSSSTASELTVSASVSGVGGLVKSGAGALVLSGSNGFTGSTTVSSGTLMAAASGGPALGATSSVTVHEGGTLLLGAANQIGDASAMTLGGGTFRTGGFSEGTTSSAGLGALTLTANSTLDFGVGSSVVAFASGFNPSTFTLDILNWTYGADRLIFQEDISDRLSAFSFGGQSAGQIALGGGFFEIVPVPEPATILGGLLLLGALAWREGRRYLGRR